MKIQDSLHRIYQNGNIPQTSRAKPATPPKTAERPPQTSGHKNIPRDYRPKMGLNRKEQTFFARMFPAHKRQIEAYLQQQNNTVPEKGKIIDMKG